MADLPLIRIDADVHQAWMGDRPLRLAHLEYRTLAYLTACAGRVVTRAELSNEVWETDCPAARRTIDQHIGTLRKALGESGTDPRYVITVRKVGWIVPRALVEQSAAPEPEDEVAGLHDLATTLRFAIVDIRAYIEAEAHNLAAPRIAQAEQDAAERVRAVEAERDAERQRHEDLVAELRRQIAVPRRLPLTQGTS